MQINPKTVKQHKNAMDFVLFPAELQENPNDTSNALSLLSVPY